MSVRRVLEAAGLVTAVVLASAVPAAAQSGQLPLRSIRGTVFDSLLSQRRLAGAEVFLEGLDRRAYTDSLGAFVFEALPQGPYRIGFGHESLDSLGATGVRWMVQLGPEDAVVELATPAERSLLERRCRASLPDELGVVTGVVEDADRRARAAGARVELEWTTTTLSSSAGLRVASEVERRSAITDDAGVFVLCGVPIGTPLLMRVEAGSRGGAALVLDLGERRFAVQRVVIGRTPEGSKALPLTGVVRRPDGVLVAEASVELLGLAHSARTDSDGRFVLPLARPGTVTVEVRAIGFEPQRRIVGVSADGAAPLTVTLRPVAQQLAELTATADAVGFLRRRGSHPYGTFLTRDDIARLNPERTEDALRLATGANFPAGRGVPQMELLPGGRCVPTVFVDGRPVDEVVIGSGDVQLPSSPALGLEALARPSSEDPGKPGYRYPLRVAPEDVYGIEVYDRRARVPPELAGRVFMDADRFLRTVHCGVFIWTRAAMARMR